MLLSRDQAALATRTPEGSATLHLSIDSRAAVAEAWGPGARWVLENAPALVGADDDPTVFRPRHPVMRELHRARGGLRIPRCNNVLEILVPTILEQKVTGHEARRAYRRLVHRFGEPAPGPYPLVLPPHPKAFAELPYYEFHPFGVERRRAETIRSVCARAARLARWAELGSDTLRTKLLSLPGVGAWTAGHVQMLALGDCDAVTVGDFHLPHMVAWTLTREPRASDERMLELLEPYKGHRGRAQRLIETSGIRPPAFGPRKARRSIEMI